MPEIHDIIASVQYKQLIKDSFIQQGSFIQNRRDVVHYTGGFTVVFPVEVNGEKWAFRCWYHEIGNVAKRFKIISEYLNKLNSPYLCEFVYCDEGIVVDGMTFPTTRMKWVEGETLDIFIERNKNNPSALKALASSFVEMVDYLHKHHIAHGDLQHGNIIVDNGEITLVDYDSMYVPGLDGNSDIVIGKAEYQHPKRRDAKIVTEKLDYFSELVIYLTLMAVAKSPDILERFPVTDSGLFKASDWTDLEQSKAYKALKDIRDDEIDLLLHILADYLKEDDINKLEPFTDVVRRLSKKPELINISVGKADGIVYKGVKSRVKWVVENVEKQYVNGVEVPVSERECDMQFDSDTEIELLLINGMHTVTVSKSIKVVEQPEITFTTDKELLKDDNGQIDTATLTWSVSNASHVEVKTVGLILSNESAMEALEVKPRQDTEYVLAATGLDNVTVFKQKIKIRVRKPAVIVFSADKEFCLPKVPVTLRWDVSFGNRVTLNGEEVKSSGTRVVTLEKDQRYELCVEDDFNTQTKQLEIKMLPLPFVEKMVVPMPKIDEKVSIVYVAPQFAPIPPVPTIEFEFAKISTEPIPGPKETGVFVELMNTPQEGLKQRVSKFVKRLFTK